MYISVEGVIGVGKTTLSRMLSERMKFRPMLEIVEENPFLASFYADMERWAFQTQLFFLLSRYSQQSEITKAIKNEDVVSDYIFEKDRLFAELNLSGDQLELYERVFDILDSKVSKPDLIVYLRASVGTIMKRIAMRDRVFERDMDVKYISKLANAYEGFFARYSGNFLTVNADEIDFVQNETHFDLILSKMKRNGVEL